MRLREQLASTSQREATQRQQLRTCEDNLAMCQQELQELRHQLHQKHEQPREIVDSDLSAEVAARERAMLEFMLELVGRDRIRTLLNELPDASPGQLRQEILQLARTQHLSAAPMSPRSLALTQRIGIPKKQSSAPAPLLPSRSPSTLDVVYEKYVQPSVSFQKIHTGSRVVSLRQDPESEWGQINMLNRLQVSFLECIFV